MKGSGTMDPDANAGEIHRIHAGTAKVGFTPSTVSDSLILHHQFIRVIAFSDGDRKALLVAHEDKWTRDELWEEMAERINEETGIGREYVLMSAVHTHGGVPPGPDFGDRMMSCVKEALASLEPARVGMGKGECRMSMNRRERDVSGTVILGKNPYEPCDHEVGVLRVDDGGGHPMSIMVNWPCHAVVNFPEPTRFSGDWPGAAAQHVEEAFGNEVTVPVTIGASGDINPLYHYPYPPDERRKNEEGLAITARYLGEEAVRVANEIVTRPAGRIRAAQRDVALPGMERLKSRAPDQEIVQGDDLHVRLTAIKVGNIVFAGLGGEVMTEIGMQLKERSPHRNTFAITHCNGSAGYLVTDRALKEGGLEPSRTRGMPGTDRALVANLLEMIDEL